MLSVKESRLSGGPQDGARITDPGGNLPERVHVGPKWLGDGFAAWSDEPCPRFPAVYEWDGRKHVFKRFQTNN